MATTSLGCSRTCYDDFLEISSASLNEVLVIEQIFGWLTRQSDRVVAVIDDIVRGQLAGDPDAREFSDHHYTL